MQHNKIYVKPIYWSNIFEEESYCFLFGYTPNNRTVFIKVLLRNLYKITFAKTPDNQMIENILSCANSKLIPSKKLNKKTILLSTSDYIKREDYKDVVDITPMQRKLSLVFKVNNIRPYEWLYVLECNEFINKYTRCDHDLYMYEQYLTHTVDKIELEYNLEKYLFWDASTYDPNNDKAKTHKSVESIRIADISKKTSSSSINSIIDESRTFNFSRNVFSKRIYSISIIIYTEYNVTSYVITDRDVDSVEVSNVKYIKVKDENEIIKWMFNLISIYTPDYLISFNSDWYTIPFLIDRMIFNEYVNNIDYKVLDKPFMIKNLRLNDVFDKPVIKNTISIEGITLIDIYNYYNRFFPYLFESNINFDKDSLIQFRDVLKDKNLFIGGKKYNLPSSYENKICMSNNKEDIFELLHEKMSALRDISLICLNNNMMNNIKLTCNNLNILMSELLTSSINIIVNNIFDEISNNKKRTIIYKKCKQGVYMGCYMYMFHNLYIDIMKSSDNINIMNLSDKLKGCPPIIITNVFYSEQFKQHRRVLKKVLLKVLNEHINDKSIIFINNYYMISNNKINKEYLTLVDKLITFQV